MSCSPCISSPAPDQGSVHGFSRALWPTLHAGLIGLVLAGLTACEEPPKLPAVGADLSQTSVSGLSSGAYMAGQFQFAHSDIIIGAGLVAGGPYGCAESVFGRMNPIWSVALAQNLNRAVNGCTGTAMASLGVPDIKRLARRAHDRADSGTINKLASLKSDRIYLFTSKSDGVVASSLVRKSAKLYERLGVKKQNISLVENVASGHGFITLEGGGTCNASRPPFINDCDYDQAGAILKHIYGPLKLPQSEQKDAPILFGQAEFSGASSNGLDGLGAVTIPESCIEKKGCRVHIAFHGCKQAHEMVENAFINGSGFNRWAANNRLIVLYPQVSKSTANPQGCWDWWGYTGKKFLTRNAPQIRAVRAMLARLAE